MALVVNISHKMNAEVKISSKFKLEKGSTLGIHGPSGVGKTTLLRSIGGLFTPDQGLIQWNDQTWLDTATKTFSSPQDRSVGMVFQRSSLFSHMTVEQNIKYSANISKKEVEDIVNGLDIQQLVSRKPEKLSGGQIQRVEIARALCYNPELLLLDEPFSGQDEKMLDSMLVFLQSKLQPFNTTLVICSHNMRALDVISDEQFGLGAK